MVRRKEVWLQRWNYHSKHFFPDFEKLDCFKRLENWRKIGLGVWRSSSMLRNKIFLPNKLFHSKIWVRLIGTGEYVFSITMKHSIFPHKIYMIVQNIPMSHRLWKFYCAFRICILYGLLIVRLSKKFPSLFKSLKQRGIFPNWLFYNWLIKKAYLTNCL